MDLKKSLGHDIYFREGLLTFQLNLSDKDPKYSNIIVLDDLTDLAVDSQIISKLFTREAQECKRDLAASECFSKRQTQHEHQL